MKYSSIHVVMPRHFIVAWFLFVIISLFGGSVAAKDLLAAAEQQLQNGFYRAALSTYKQVLVDSQQTASLDQQQLAEAGLGHTFYLSDQPQKAIHHLQRALVLSQSENKVNGYVHYYLSLVHSQLADTEAFESHWQYAMTDAKLHADPILQSHLYLSVIKWTDDKTDFDQYLQQIQQLLSQATPSQDWGIIYLNVAEQLIKHRLLEPIQGTERDRIRRSHQYLQQAKQYLPDTALRPQAKIAGLLGMLYEADERYPEALTLSSQALQLAQQASAQDLLLLYEWQAGRLYHKLAQQEAAIDSYRRAINHVEAIRQDIPVRYQDGKSSFKELLEPLYLDLANLLLVKASPKQNNKKQSLLNETRDILEQLKQTELEDFFQDRCLVENDAKFSLDEIDTNTAVLYPVLLPDRFEWLISINGQLHQSQIEQSRDQLDQKIRQYSADLRNVRASNANQELYQLLFKPIESLLQQQGIKTLVYVPDGVLRLIPLGVLSDGDKYLIEKYAVVTIPGLNLLNAQIEIDRSGKSLLVGLSHPPVAAVEKLPIKMLTELTGYTAEQETDEQRNILISKTRSAGAAVAPTLNNRQALQDDRTRTLEKLAEALALPGVITEIKKLAKSLPNTSLLNQDFTLSNFQQETTENDYGIVHIASHGFFGGDSKDSFIMTHDELLTIDNLENMLHGRKQDSPVNMLTLSACQTAEGDDRAPLGFSGVAIKANAQTALGSLWPISDTAAVKLMNSFYQQLIVEHHSKAKALQIAQQEFINDPEMNNPFFWAPFILVGHWQ